jgi:solute carrier family 25 phosphate transporter 23/24/25/41
VLEKEKELWSLFSEINQSSDFKLRPKDLQNALEAAGIHVTNDDITEFVQCIDTGIIKIRIFYVRDK